MMDLKVCFNWSFSEASAICIMLFYVMPSFTRTTRIQNMLPVMEAIENNVVAGWSFLSRDLGNPMPGLQWHGRQASQITAIKVEPFTCYAKFFRGNTKYIYVLCHSSKLIWHRKLKYFLKKDKDLLILHGQYYGSWCPGDARSQGISNRDIDLVKPR